MRRPSDAQPASLSRRALIAGAVVATLTTAVRRARAEEVAVPVTLQAQLLAKVAAYDRNMAARCKGKARVLVLDRPDDVDSRTVASQMAAALGSIGTIAGLPVEASVATIAAASLAQEVKSRGAAIVYVAPGLDASVPDYVRALTGLDVLSVGAIARFVQAGIVLGFDLVSGKPKISIHLTQAQKQNVAIRPDVLSLMTVYK